MRRVDKILELSSKYANSFKPTSNEEIAGRLFISAGHVKNLKRELHKDVTLTSMLNAYVTGHSLCAYKLKKGMYLVESLYYNDIAFYNGLWDLICEELAGRKLEPPTIPNPADIRPTVFRILGAVRICNRICYAKNMATGLSDYQILKHLGFVSKKTDTLMSSGWINKYHQVTKDALLQFVVMSRKFNETNYVQPYTGFWIIQSDMAFMNYLCIVRPTIRAALEKAIKGK